MQLGVQHLTARVYGDCVVTNSQCGVVGAPHGEEPLEGVRRVGVLHDALGLQVGHQQGDGLQKLLLRELKQSERREGTGGIRGID